MSRNTTVTSEADAPDDVRSIYQGMKNIRLDLLGLDLVQVGLDTNNREMVDTGLLVLRSVIEEAFA